MEQAAPRQQRLKVPDLVGTYGLSHRMKSVVIPSDGDVGFRCGWKWALGGLRVGSVWAPCQAVWGRVEVAEARRRLCDLFTGRVRLVGLSYRHASNTHV